MTVEAWLRAATTELQQAGIDSARLDCLILLEDVTCKDRAWLLAHPEYPLLDDSIEILHKNIIQRKQHTPLAYIRHTTEFYGHTFYVDHRVLEPRPESEAIIDMLKQLAPTGQPHIVDVGTGSGALAITAALELPHARISATDIDPACLKVARRNAKLHEVTINFSQTDLVQNILDADIILANLPYVPDDFHINLAAGHEPRLAIFGGPDGLDLYRRMFEQLHNYQQKHILTESLPTQHKQLASLANSFGYDEHTRDGFIQLFEPSSPK